jgi:hypothetical protein
MVKKKKRGSRDIKNYRKRNNKDNSKLKRFEKELDKEFKEVEDWVIERRRFFIKLGWTILLILVLLLISHLFLRSG